MEKKDSISKKLKVNYLNPVATLIMVLILTIGITRPLSGESLFNMAKQHWFYIPFVGTFAAMIYLFLIIDSITIKLDKHWRWEEYYMKRFFYQTILAWIVPSVFIAFTSWLYFDTLRIEVMLSIYTWSMFLILLAIALFINGSYVLYYFYRFVNHLATIQKEEQEVEESSFFLVPDGRGQKKIAISEIAYVFHEDGNVFLRTVSGINYPLDQSLEAIKKILVPKNFHQVNRNYIISYGSYVSWKKDSGNHTLLTLNPPANRDVVVSRNRITGTKLWISEDPSLLNPVSNPLHQTPFLCL